VGEIYIKNQKAFPKQKSFQESEKPSSELETFINRFSSTSISQKDPKAFPPTHQNQKNETKKIPSRSFRPRIHSLHHHKLQSHF
jgi:hypothetical protein